MDAIFEVRPGARYLSSQQTSSNFETAFFRAESADNNSFEQWRAGGSKDAAVRASAMWAHVAGIPLPHRIAGR